MSKNGIIENVEFISNGNEKKKYDLIKSFLLDENLKRYFFNVAFISWGGVQILLDVFTKLERKNANAKEKSKIITTSYLNFTDPKILRYFKNLEHVEIKFVDKSTIVEKQEYLQTDYHPKAYIFEFENCYKVLLGSANITTFALKTNTEWSFLITYTKNKDIKKLNEIAVGEEFLKIWNNLKELTEDMINEYNEQYKNSKKPPVSGSTNSLITEKPFQKEAIENLSKLRQAGEKKALIIAATGTGKTYLSAFDVKNFNSKKMLFIVHRNEILTKAKSSFESVVHGKSASYFKGNKKNKESDMVFASIQTLHRNLKLFDKDEFDYIIIDEAHHIGSYSYQKVLEHFDPKFLLGMTATPMRADGINIYKQFDNNVALNFPLMKAIEENCVVNFHYFGIEDKTSLGEAKNDDELEKKIKEINEDNNPENIKKMVEILKEQIEKYKFDGIKMHCLVFCVNTDHAKSMSKELNDSEKAKKNKSSFESVYIVSKTSTDKREKFLEKFEDDNDPLNIIFSVDIFNEGVDIPAINLVVFFRPTNSPTIFIQQLGRGLRKTQNKEYLTILDFIGNHKNNYLLVNALANVKHYQNKESIEKLLLNNFRDFNGLHIELDEKSREKILKSLDNLNTNNWSYLKKKYLELKSSLNQNKPINFMMDYFKIMKDDLQFDILNDVINFSKCKEYKSYLSFVNKTDKETAQISFTKDSDKDFHDFLKAITQFLPIKRINEFALIYHIIENNLDSISFTEAKEVISKYIDNIEDKSIKSSFELLAKHDFSTMFKLSNNENGSEEWKNLKFETKDKFKKIVNNDEWKKYLLDCLEFGKNLYLETRKKENKGKHFEPLDLHKTYSRKEVGMNINYSPHGFRYQSFFFVDNQWYYFSTIYQDNNHETFEFEDELIDNKNFRWLDTKNQLEKIKGHDIHFFIRKYKKIHGETQPYYYLGKSEVQEEIIEIKNDKLRLNLELDEIVPSWLFKKLTKEK